MVHPLSHMLCALVCKKKKEKKNDSGFENTPVLFSVLVLEPLAGEGIIFTDRFPVGHVVAHTGAEYQDPCWLWR